MKKYTENTRFARTILAYFLFSLPRFTGNLQLAQNKLMHLVLPPVMCMISFTPPDFQFFASRFQGVEITQVLLDRRLAVQPHLAVNTPPGLSDQYLKSEPISEIPSGGNNLAIEILDKFKKATVPQNIESVLALSCAEVVSGFVAGLSSRQVADLLQDRKIDNRFTKGASTGAFFGTRALFRTIGFVLGFPRPVALLISSLSGSIISEATKYFGRRTRTDTEIGEEEPIEKREILADITKWLLYDTLSEMTTLVSGSCSEFSSHAIFGAFSSVCAYLIRIKPGQGSATVSTSFKVALEGAVLFLAYEEVLVALKTILPQDFNKKMLFDEIVEELEEEIKKQ